MRDAVLARDGGAVREAGGDVVCEIGIYGGKYGGMLRYGAYAGQEVDC